MFFCCFFVLFFCVTCSLLEKTPGFFKTSHEFIMDLFVAIKLVWLLCFACLQWKETTWWLMKSYNHWTCLNMFLLFACMQKNMFHGFMILHIYIYISLFGLPFLFPEEKSHTQQHRFWRKWGWVKEGRLCKVALPLKNLVTKAGTAGKAGERLAPLVAVTDGINCRGVVGETEAEATATFEGWPRPMEFLSMKQKNTNQAFENLRLWRKI